MSERSNVLTTQTYIGLHNRILAIKKSYLISNCQTFRNMNTAIREIVTREVLQKMSNLTSVVVDCSIHLRWGDKVCKFVYFGLKLLKYSFQIIVQGRHVGICPL